MLILGLTGEGLLVPTLGPHVPDCFAESFTGEIWRTKLCVPSYGIAQFTEGGTTMRDPFTAGILSFIIPGVGQLYNGRILAGILWLIITPGFWIGSGGTLGWICHIIAAYTAYSYAKDHPVRV